MTYAPPTLTALARYWVSKGGVNLGVVGDAAHQRKGTSYHLGRSGLALDAYSRKTARDRAGLTDAASAIDLGKLKGPYFAQLRDFSAWLVKRCQANAPGTSDIREVIYTTDGKTVLRYDRERGVRSAPRTGEASLSHLTHTHISFYRDSEKRSKVGLFSPYFTPKPVIPAPQPKEAPMSHPIVAAIHKRADYWQTEFEAGDKSDALVHALKIIDFGKRLADAVAPVPTKAVAVDDAPDKGLVLTNLDVPASGPDVPVYTGPFPVFSGTGDPNLLPDAVIAAFPAFDKLGDKPGAYGDGLDTLKDWFAYQLGRAYAAERGIIVNDPHIARHQTPPQYLRDVIYGGSGRLSFYGPTAGEPQQAEEAAALAAARTRLGL